MFSSEKYHKIKVNPASLEQTIDTLSWFSVLPIRNPPTDQFYKGKIKRHFIDTKGLKQLSDPCLYPYVDFQIFGRKWKGCIWDNGFYCRSQNKCLASSGGFFETFWILLINLCKFFPSIDFWGKLVVWFMFRC